MSIYIATSGWSYSHWDGVLYPHGLAPYRRLAYYTDRFRTVELNASYYRWPRDAAFASWRRRLPEEFLMSIKAPGQLTHRLRLYSPERWLERINAGLKLLGPRCGPLLVQLPPNFPFDFERLRYFLERFPPSLRVALEFRHPSWHSESVWSLLEAHGAAYCVTSGARLPCVLQATADFVYVRMHGPDRSQLYAGSYSDDDLRWWAERVREWTSQGRDVFVYFNNDGEGNAVRNADTLKRFLNL